MQAWKHSAGLREEVTASVQFHGSTGEPNETVIDGIGSDWMVTMGVPPCSYMMIDRNASTLLE